MICVCPDCLTWSEVDLNSPEAMNHRITHPGHKVMCFHKLPRFARGWRKQTMRGTVDPYEYFIYKQKTGHSLGDPQAGHDG